MRCLVLVLICAAAAMAQDQRSPREVLQEAVEFQQAGKLKEAISDYRLFLAAFPDYPEVRSNLGAALAASGRYLESIVEYKRSLDAKPDPNVRLNLALAYYKTGQLEEAARQLETVRGEMPGNIQVVLLLADCQLQLGENSKVIEMLNPLWRAGASDLGIPYLLGTAFIREKRFAEGQAAIDQLFARGDSAETRLLMGSAKMANKKFLEALEDFQKATEMNPQLSGAFDSLGTALLATGDTDRAKSAFEKELQNNPFSMDANLQLGILSKQDKEYDKASQYLQAALKLRPDNIAIVYELALVNFETGNIEKAQLSLENIVKETPKFTEAHVRLATIYYREKRKADGDRERAIIDRLNAEKQAKEPAQAPEGVAQK